MAEYEKGLVSVVIPTYKRSDLLKKAIDSVLHQTYQKIQLLVVNDNPIGDVYSQALYALLSEYDDPRLRLVEQEKHINGAAARNAGIRQATGEYIAFQDDDDYWEPDKIERQVRLLSSLDASWGAVSCLARTYKNGELTLCALPYRSGEILMDVLTCQTSLETGAVLIRRSALDDSGYFDEHLKRHQDLQLFARLTEKYKVQLDPVYLHNRETKDGRNRPSADQLREIKQAYFSSIRDILDRLSSKDRERVYIMHDFECACVLIRNGQSKEGLRKFLGVCRTPRTLYMAIKRIAVRMIGQKCRYMLQKRYAGKRG